MPLNRREFFAGALASSSALAALSNPNVRAITAFLRLDRARYPDQIVDTLKMLRQARRTVEAGGYKVETVRIVTQPFPEYTQGLSRANALRFFRDYDELAAKESFAPNIGPALLNDNGDPAQAGLLGEILSETKTLKASIIMGDATGIQWKAVQSAARLVKFVADHSPGSLGNFNFAATAMLQPYGPFYPGAYHLAEGRRFAVAAEFAGVVDHVFGETGANVSLATERLTAALSSHAVALDKLGLQIEKEIGWTYMGVDPTPAPMRDVSIGAAIEKFIGAKFGSRGTMTACAVITKAVQSTPVKRAGFSGLMLPIMEDTLLAQRWTEATYDIDGLLAYSAVCGTGLDTVPMPGGAPVEQIARILGDVATLAVKWNKPLTARLLPIAGKQAGDRTSFNDPSLVNTAIRAIA